MCMIDFFFFFKDVYDTFYKKNWCWHFYLIFFFIILLVVDYLKIKNKNGFDL
jgi:hypothetical protein